MRVLIKGLVPALLILVLAHTAWAEDEARRKLFDGTWVLNEELSDDTDKRVERAIKDGGGKVRRGKKEKGRYRGGPVSQKLYDHISYDESLQIDIDEPEFRFSYPEGFKRVFYSDGRSRTVSAYSGASSDYSFADWDGDVLYVESAPLDAGHILETYQLLQDGAQLQLDAVLEPSSFVAPITLKRVFDRSDSN